MGQWRGARGPEHRAAFPGGPGGLGPADRGDQRLGRYRRGESRVLRRCEHRAGEARVLRARWDRDPRRGDRPGHAQPGHGPVAGTGQERLHHAHRQVPAHRRDRSTQRVGMGNPGPRRCAAPVGGVAACGPRARAHAAEAERAAGDPVAAVRRPARHRPDHVRDGRIGAERVARRRRGRAAPTRQRRPEGVHLRPGPRQLDPWLPRPGQAGPPARREVLALTRTGRRAAHPRRPDRRGRHRRRIPRDR